MKLLIKHTTRHEYDGEVSFGNHLLFLRPFDGQKRRVAKFEVKTTPESTQRWVHDTYGNSVLVCNFGLETSKELSFFAEIEIERDEDNPFDFILDPDAVAYPLKYNDRDSRALLPFFGEKAQLGELKVLDWFYNAVSEPVQHPSIVQFLIELSEAIRRDIDYVTRHEEGVQPPDETLQLKTGSCRDMAVLFMSTVRQLGLAARFVSGYLFDPPVDDSGDHVYNRAVGSMHAWVDVYLPGAGWKGFDPTNGILANENFLPCAVSHDPLAVNPIQGAYFSKQSASSTMSVDLQIEQLSE